MKKILSILLVLALVFGIAGCQVSNYFPKETTASTTETTTETTTLTETVTVPEESDPTDATTAPTEKPEPKPTEPAPTQPRPTQPPQDEEELPEQTKPTQPPQDEDILPEQTLPTQPPQEEDEPTEPTTEATEPEPEPTTKPSTDKSYTGKEEVAQYIDLYGCLPDNFITKSQARALGWKSGRRLEDYAPGKCIGGDRFYNKEGLLPSGHTYYECDIDTLGKTARGAKRIVFSSDGLIYYTSDHYESFYQYLEPNQWVKI